MLKIIINIIRCHTTILAIFVSVTVMYKHVRVRVQVVSYSSCALKVFFAVSCEQIRTGVVFD